MYYDFVMTQDNYRPDEKDIRYILSEDNYPWEIGPGFAKRVDMDEPLSDIERTTELTFILSGAIDISKEEAERIAKRDNE